MSKKEVTLDLDIQTYVEEKMKRTRKVPYSEKMLENLAKGRERRKQLLEEKKQNELENIQIYELLSLSPKFSSLPDYVLHTGKHC